MYRRADVNSRGNFITVVFLIYIFRAGILHGCRFGKGKSTRTGGQEYILFCLSKQRADPETNNDNVINNFSGYELFIGINTEGGTRQSRGEKRSGTTRAEKSSEG